MPDNTSDEQPLQLDYARAYRYRHRREGRLLALVSILLAVVTLMVGYAAVRNGDFVAGIFPVLFMGCFSFGMAWSAKTAYFRVDANEFEPGNIVIIQPRATLYSLFKFFIFTIVATTLTIGIGAWLLNQPSFTPAFLMIPGILVSGWLIHQTLHIALRYFFAAADQDRNDTDT